MEVLRQQTTLRLGRNELWGDWIHDAIHKVNKTYEFLMSINKLMDVLLGR